MNKNVNCFNNPDWMNEEITKVGKRYASVELLKGFDEVESENEETVEENNLDQIPKLRSKSASLMNLLNDSLFFS
jgi:hypothetical protein